MAGKLGFFVVVNYARHLDKVQWIKIRMLVSLTLRFFINNSDTIDQLFIPAMVLPLPTPAPSPTRKPALFPSGRNCSCCWLAYTKGKYQIRFKF